MDEHADHLRRLAWLIFLVAVAVVLATVPGVRPNGLIPVSPPPIVLAGAALVVLLMPWAQPHPERFPLLPLITLALLGIAVAFTDGGRSPLTPFYGPIIAVAAAFYPPRALTLVTLAALIGRSSFLLYEERVASGEVARLAVDVPVLVVVAVLTAVIARRLSHATMSAALLPYLRGRTATAVERARSAQALQAASFQTMVRLAEAVEARDVGTAAHCRRVAAYSTAIAAEMHLPASKMEDIARGALLHDIGKIAIPDAVLLKDGALTDAEWSVMRRHAQIGYELLGKLPYLEHARELVYSHHERWDGKGYPRGLKGAEIAIGARIFAFADALDAMSCDRPYRKALPPHVIIEELKRGSGTQFDPEVVAAFMRTLSPDSRSSATGWPLADAPQNVIPFDIERLRRRAAEQKLPGIDHQQAASQ